MKLTSIIKVASVAIALAAIPAIAEDGGMTVNGTIVAGSGTVVANLLSPANVKESMEELAKDPDATVVTDDKGNVKSVKIVKSTSSGIVVKDGEVVKTWENEPTDEDIKKKIDEIRAMIDSYGR